ncbi:MAG: trypsin-like serine protease [Polyangiaceae bacterium]|nr:trypsin-like serine protease [Polyangiaceae bacterium]
MSPAARRFCLLVALLPGAGCGSADPPAPAAVASPIIGGSPDPNESGTVAITHLDYGLLCSGTLIAPTLVVTAKHCAFLERASGPDEPLAGDRFRVGFGPAWGQLTWRGTTSLEWVGMPGELEVDAAVAAGEDVALLHLASAAPASAHVHSVRLDYVPKAGDSLTIVGYGRSSLSSDTSGVKLQTTDAFHAFDGSTGILTAKGKGACSGDSGGSFYFGGLRELVGVTSTAAGSSTTSFCDVGITHASSVRNPRVNALLAAALGVVPSCTPIDEVCGDGLDQDCDQIPDNGCLADGAACTSDVACRNGACIDLGAGPVCGRRCDRQTTCPPGQRCVGTCGEGHCTTDPAGSGPLLAACTTDAECASSHCSSAGCTTLCGAALGECPDDQACATTGACGECVPLAAAPDPRRLGEACAVDADCTDGAVCAGDGFGVGRCATTCFQGSICPDGFRCDAGRCVRGAPFALGERCTKPELCSSGLCATYPEPHRNFCTRRCTNGSGCPDGFACASEFSTLVCVPAIGRLGEPCAADSQCTTDRCDPTLGACTRACSPTSAPCPAGFTCDVVGGALLCRAAPGAFPPDAGAGGAGGAGGAVTDAGATDAGGFDAGAGGAGGAGAGGGPAGGRASPDDDGSCAVTTGGGTGRRGAHGLAAGLGLLAALRRRRLRAAR